MTDETLDAPLIRNVNGSILGQLQMVIPRRDYSFARLAPSSMATIGAGEGPVLTQTFVATPWIHPAHGPCLCFLGDREVLTGLQGFKRLW